jgi:predicted RNA binding protein YcfA (HicA-like mRNA interferase family)
VPRKLRELRADLRGAGFVQDHQTGSHQIWKHDKLPEMIVNVAGNDGADAKPYQERDVRRAIMRVRSLRGGTP